MALRDQISCILVRLIISKDNLLIWRRTVEKNAPTVPLERKHISLQRPTVLHSTTIPPKEQVNNPREANRFSGHFTRFPQAPQRIPVAKPGRILSPVIPFENGSIKEPTNTRRLMRNTMLPPQPSLPSSIFSFHINISKIESERGEAVDEVQDNSCRHKPPQPFMPSKITPEVAVDIGGVEEVLS
ncbi:hypothetical protein IEQ34_014484 [Dendrobium chrysotoxum]|uniref:Uncharacterized protein n=1 Tax=Dendrobium chrysotoxum TaxID=161865 RepID=A0AAV7GKW7_DENCH|nr:hypothetical protein IEQ34_014484 [Dendrobium chrysotoxum]